MPIHDGKMSAEDRWMSSLFASALRRVVHARHETVAGFDDPDVAPRVAAARRKTRGQPFTTRGWPGKMTTHSPR
jgi:hypothetical protein